MSDEQPTSDAAPSAAEDETRGDEELSSAEALKKGMGLLWQAAKSAADEIQKEVDVEAVKASLHKAGKDIEVAAQEAAKALEGFIDRTGPGEPSPNYTDQWPPDEGTKAKQVDADVPEDGGTDESGEKRDFRIQVDDDD